MNGNKKLSDILNVLSRLATELETTKVNYHLEEHIFFVKAFFLDNKLSKIYRRVASRERF